MKAFILIAIITLSAIGQAQIIVPVDKHQPVALPDHVEIPEDDNTIYSTAALTIKPEFPGGVDKFYQFIAKNVQQPEEAEAGGKVFVSFVIEKDGTLSNLKVLRDFGLGSGEEVVRVLQLSPKWIPGKQNGRKVRTQFNFPVVFQPID